MIFRSEQAFGIWCTNKVNIFLEKSESKGRIAHILKLLKLILTKKTIHYGKIEKSIQKRTFHVRIPEELPRIGKLISINDSLFQNVVTIGSLHIREYITTTDPSQSL